MSSAQDGVEDAKGTPQVNGRTPARFMPFSMGGRDCVGQTLAKLNLATTLAQLYGSFTFKLAEEVRGVSHLGNLPAYGCQRLSKLAVFMTHSEVHDQRVCLGNCKWQQLCCDKLWSHEKRGNVLTTFQPSPGAYQGLSQCRSAEH